MKKQDWFDIAVIVFATILNAAADATMLKMGFDVGSLLDFPDWSQLQWQWHLLKWGFFNVAFGYFSTARLGWLKTAGLGIVCLFIWNAVYSAMT
jgi:hypothetical protein